MCVCCLSDTVSLSFSHSLYVLTHFLIKSFFTEKKKERERENQQSCDPISGSDGPGKLRGAFR